MRKKNSRNLDSFASTKKNYQGTQLNFDVAFILGKTKILSVGLRTCPGAVCGQRYDSFRFKGFNINGISDAINFEDPISLEIHVHQLGSLAQSEKKCMAFSFSTPNTTSQSLKVISFLEEASQEDSSPSLNSQHLKTSFSQLQSARATNSVSKGRNNNYSTKYETVKRKKTLLQV